MSDPQPQEDWVPLVSSIFVSLYVGVQGMVTLIYQTRKSRKAHLLNVFSQLFYSLFFMSMLVRSLYWIAWVHQGTPGTKDFGIPLNIRAFRRSTY